LASCAGDPSILTSLLRDELGFDGVVVADYFAVGLLTTHHHVAATRGDAAVLALTTTGGNIGQAATGTLDAGTLNIATRRRRRRAGALTSRNEAADAGLKGIDVRGDRGEEVGVRRGFCAIGEALDGLRPGGFCGLHSFDGQFGCRGG